MGIIIESQKLPSMQDLSRLRIYCKADEATRQSAVSLNQIVAAELLKIKPTRRTMQMTRCFDSVLAALPDGAIIKDIDVFFNPEYKIDVLKMFADAYRRKPFSIVWSGTVEGTKLVYSEEGMRDYKTYEINDYDIVCVV